MRDALRRYAAAFITTAMAGSLPLNAVAADTCDEIRSLRLAHVSVDRTELVPAGKAQPPRMPGMPSSPDPIDLPAYCKVALTIKPTPASDIKTEVWLPASGWNRKLLAVGNGGWSGAIFHFSMFPGLQRGYAVVATDTGHSGGPGDGSFAYRQPEKLIDFGWRAVHESTVAAKAIVNAFYDAPAARAYWQGCSSGGKQGLKEAQRFPEDFDGIIAGAPANPWTRLTASSLSAGLAALPKDAPALLPRDRLQLLRDAAVASCDANDGVTDGVIEDPRTCKFEPASVVCDDPSRCLTKAQAAAATRIYSPLIHPQTNEPLYAGFPRGSELGWTFITAGPKPLNIAHDHFRFVVFENPDWDPYSFDLARDVARADEIDAKGGQLNAADPDLDAFRARGSKLLMYHGWGDGAIPAGSSIDYFESVLARDKASSREAGLARLQQNVRLFMAPGLDHCFGGRGATQFDTLSVLERWVEQGIAPDSIDARGKNAADQPITRKLCPYPRVARYDGRSDPDRAESFRCE